MELSERKKKILAAVVEQYIRTGEPVGSKTLLDCLDISVSSATVRNEMAELGYLGLLDQPHTSAGRVPTGDGYRFYVDNLVPETRLSEESRRLIDAGLENPGGDPESLLTRAGDTLAYLTKCAAVMTTPSGENTRIKRVELVPISAHTAMIVLLVSNGMLRSKLFRLDGGIDVSLCETFYNVSQAALVGAPVNALTPAYLQSLAARLGMEALAMFPMLSAVAELSQGAAQPRVFLSGQSNLLHHREYAGRAYELLEFLNRGTPLNNLIDRMNGELEIRIGRENGYIQLDNSSVLLAKYSAGEDSSGSIGIIGPTRMDYRRLVPGLKYISSRISKTMTEALEE